MTRIGWVAVVGLVACGGSGQDASDVLGAQGAAVASPQRVITPEYVNALSGLDCSADPCPVIQNLECLAIGTKKQCFFVVAPADGCLTVRVDRTFEGETTPVVCAPSCQGSDLPGAPTCPHELKCSGDAARYCFE